MVVCSLFCSDKSPVRVIPVISLVLLKQSITAWRHLLEVLALVEKLVNPGLVNRLDVFISNAIQLDNEAVQCGQMAHNHVLVMLVASASDIALSMFHIKFLAAALINCGDSSYGTPPG